MPRFLQMIIFMSIFLSIYGSINGYVIWRLMNLFGEKLTKISYLLILISTASFFLAAVLERLSHNIVTRFIYGIAGVWMGMLFFLLSSLLIYEGIKLFIKIEPKQAGISILIFVTLISIYATINAFLINIKEISIPLQNLSQNIKIVQLTDLHIGTIHNSGFLKKVIQKVNTINPDIIVITGDLIDGSGLFHPETYTQLNNFEAPTFFVTGNHETYTDIEKFRETLQDTQIKILIDEKTEFKGLQIIGLNYTENEEVAKTALNQIQINSNQPSLLLAHNPKIIKLSNQAGIDLQLSGHTHNGQIYPFNFIVKLFYPEINGIYKNDKTTLYVSPGTGTWGPPMRLGSQNEITVINLKKR